MSALIWSAHVAHRGEPEFSAASFGKVRMFRMIEDAEPKLPCLLVPLLPGLVSSRYASVAEARAAADTLLPQWLADCGLSATQQGA